MELETNWSQSSDDIQHLQEFKSVLLSTRTLYKAVSIPKSIEFRDVVLFNLPDNEFRQAVRMNKPTFQFLFEEISEHSIFQNNSRNKQQDVRIQMAVALEKLGCDGNGASVGRIARCMGTFMLLNIGIGNGTVTLYVHRVLTAIVSLKSKFIRWPNAEQRKEISDSMDEEFALKGAVGIVDGTHFIFSQSPAINSEVFWTRKLRYALHATVFLLLNHRLFVTLQEELLTLTLVGQVLVMIERFSNRCLFSKILVDTFPLDNI